LQQLGAVSTRLNDQVKQILDQQLQQMRATDAASQSLGQATERVRSLVQGSGEAFGQVRPIISDLAVTARDLRAAGEGARNAQSELQQVSGIFSQQGSLLQQTTDRYATLLDQFGSIFKIIEQGLGNILQQLGEEMRRYQEVSKTSLREHLQDFDTHLANTLRQIKGSIEGINPGLEDLAEAIDSAMKHVGSNGKRG
jgi:DNA-binding FrmR family transcriptional regulator